MNAADLLVVLGRRQVTVTREADHLVVEGPLGEVTEGAIAEVRSCKAELLSLLVARSAVPDVGDVTWRAEVMWEQLPPYPRPLPLLLARPDRPYTRGACVSCGDLVQAPRCAACIAAVNLVIAQWEQAGQGQQSVSRRHDTHIEGQRLHPRRRSG